MNNHFFDSLRACCWGAALTSVVLFTSAAHAQCTKDTDCKADRVCEAGVCSAPEPSAAAAAADAPQSEAAPAPPVRSRPAPAPSGGEAQRPPPTERRSIGMMAAGIVMVSVSPIPLVGALIYAAEGATCDGYDLASDGTYDNPNCSRNNAAAVGLTLTGLALIGVGVPLIVIGAKRVPVKPAVEATVVPYATPDGAGIGLRLTM